MNHVYLNASGVMTQAQLRVRRYEGGFSSKKVDTRASPAATTMHHEGNSKGTMKVTVKAHLFLTKSTPVPHQKLVFCLINEASQYKGRETPAKK